MSEYKKIENCKAELKCVLEGDKWHLAQDNAFKKIASKIEIKGFRKGTAPKNLVEKYIRQQEVLVEAAENLAQEALNNALDEHNVDLIDRPELKIDELSADKCVLNFICPVYPDVTLGDYKSLEYKLEVPEVGDKDVDDNIAGVLDRKADLELKEDGEVEDGDTAVIDFEGFLDGVAFDGGKGENYDLVIGSNSFIPGFEQQLIGMKSEESKEISVNFPDDYHAEELKGKPATFKVTVHEIKKKVLPQLDDEFVKELKITDVNTVDQYRDYVRNNIKERKESQAKQDAENALLDKLVEMTDVDIPDIMITNETNNMVQSYEQNMINQGVSLQQFLKITNQSVEQLKDSLKDDAIRRVKIDLALKEIAKEESITISDDELNQEYDRIAKQYGMEAAEIKKQIPASYLKEDLKSQKVLDFLKK